MTRFPCSYNFDSKVYLGDTLHPVEVEGYFECEFQYVISGVILNGSEDVLPDLTEHQIDKLRGEADDYWPEYVQGCAEARAEASLDRGER